jgi:hypothetical protein
MNRRVAVAAAYTLFVLAFLLTWPTWTTPPQVDDVTVITGTRSARWLLMIVPILWSWVAFYAEAKRRRIGLIGSALLFGACFAFVWYHDNVLTYGPCLWDSGDCGGWFR